MSTLVFTRCACLEGRRDKSTSIELCASMVAKLECHLINTQGPSYRPPNRGALRLRFSRRGKQSVTLPLDVRPVLAAEAFVLTAPDLIEGL